MEKVEVESHLDRCRLRLSEPGVTDITWMGVTVSWQRLAKRDGGTSKRNGSYGRYVYEYRDKELTYSEAVDEIMKPSALRQALMEAEAVIECSMCGMVVVGREAMNPYQEVDYTCGVRHTKRAWGIMFWKMENGEPEHLSFCPSCLDAIGNGEYKEDDLDDLLEI